MILITGASGKTGQAVSKALTARGAVVRALVRRREQVAVMAELGAQDVAVGDMRDRATLHRIMPGVTAVYHISPNMAPDEVSITQAILSAAREADVQHFVYHSVLHPQIQAMPHHWQKMLAEEKVFESNIPFTILQPAAYMQNILAGWQDIIKNGVYRTPYSVETKITPVDLKDVAEAAAIALTETGHQNAIYELAGGEALSQTQAAEILSAQLKRPVSAEAIPLQSWEQSARAAGLSNYAVETLLKMFKYYECFGFFGNPHILEWLLNRPPATFAQFAQRTIASV